MARKQVQAEFDLLAAYINLSKKARTWGSVIKNSDFEKIQDDFNNSIDAIKDEQQHFFDNPEKSLLKEKELYRKYFSQNNLGKIGEDFAKEFFKKDSPEKVAEYLKGTVPLDRAFKREYGFKKKSLNVPDNVESPEQLLGFLLENNSGIAVGDTHTRNTAANFLVSNMEKFKKSGVDTIYYEHPTESFNKLNNSSIEELKKMLADITPEMSKEYANLTAKHYRVKNADDIPSATIKLFIAAKENNMEVVNIDKKSHSRDVESNAMAKSAEVDDLFMPIRLASTNFTWTDAIIKDRKNKSENSKYIIFGGASHFRDENGGLIDNALGIPYIDFSNHANTNEFIKNKSKHGADFYLPADGCYPDFISANKAMGLHGRMNNPILSLFFTDRQKTEMNDLFEKHKKEFNKTMRMECDDVMWHHETPQTTPSAEQKDKRISDILGK